jgi:S-DNA-T family DNA segregation ATPase FtsK/SpoIIIE
MPEGMKASLLRVIRVLGGLTIFLVAAILVLALASYHSGDPSLNSSASVAVTQNWLGNFGSYTADLLTQCFGYGAGVLVIVLTAWSWRVISDRPFDFFIWRAVATLVAMLTVAIVAALCQSGVEQISPSSGGAFGKLLGLGMAEALPSGWGKLLILGIAGFLAVTSLYMACSLTLGEWHIFASLLHNAGVWCAKKAHNLVLRLWHMLSGEETSNALLEDDDPEAIETQPEPDQEGDEDDDGHDHEDELPEIKPSRAIIEKKPKSPLIKRPAASTRQARLALHADSDHALPPLELLQWPESSRQHMTVSEDALEKNAKLLESVLADFGVNGTITKVSPGPVVTLYELEPSPGTRANRVISLADDIARNMSAASVRVAVVPGRNVIGIELPNARRETVYLRELLTSDPYNDTKAVLPLVLGKDIAGHPIIADMARMPHLLIAGTTGSGKSVAINTMILSLLYRLPPQKCRFIMIDPKMLELSVYEGIPHLLAPVVTEPKKAIMALRWTVREMEERYRAMSKLGVRNIEGYNVRLAEARKNNESLTRTVQTGFDRETGKPIYEEQPLDLTELPFIVVIVDEMADLMIVAGKEIESAIQRLAQMARAAGIHILMATQRPSVDVITGTIKANFPTRISFQVTSKIDSRTILGEQGAEQLLGQGDMLYMAGGGRVTRVHGPFVRDDEVEAIVKFLKSQSEPEYLDEVTEDDGQGDFTGKDSGGGPSYAGGNTSDGDGLYDKAVDVVLRERKASTSFIQRHLQIGYNKAATLIERMEKEGLIGGASATGKREVFGRRQDEE